MKKMKVALAWFILLGLASLSGQVAEEQEVMVLTKEKGLSDDTVEEPNAYQVKLGNSLWVASPKITVPYFAVVGEIRYRDVGKGYLEGTASFDRADPDYPGTSLVRRTLAEQGPLQAIKGTSDWRPFWLPFDSREVKEPFRALVINLEGKGVDHVYMRNVRVVQYPNGFPKALAPDGTLPPSEVRFPWGKSTNEEIQKSGSSTASEGKPPTGSSSGIKTLLALPFETYTATAQDQADVLENSGNRQNAGTDAAVVTFPKGVDGSTELQVVRSGEGICKQALLSIPAEALKGVTGKCYGITGEVRYSGLKRSGGALDMLSRYGRLGMSAPQDDWHGSLDGPQWGGKDSTMGQMEGTRDWGTFYLGFNKDMTTRGKLPYPALKQVILYLILDGPGTVSLRNLKLVKYPETQASAASTKADDVLPNILADPAWKGPEELVEDLTPYAMDNPLLVAGTAPEERVERSAGVPPNWVFSHEIPAQVPPDPQAPAFHNNAVFFLNHPKITADHYAVTGEVRYENAPPGTCLKLGNVFGDVEADALFGPIQPIEETSPFRSFRLPFIANANPTFPAQKLARLLLNLVTPDDHNLTVKKGTRMVVAIRNLKLVQYPPAPSVPAVATAKPSSPGVFAIRVMRSAEGKTVYGTNSDAELGPLESLQAELKTITSQPPVPSIAIHAEKDVPIADITRLMDVLKESEITSVGLIEPAKEEEAPAVAPAVVGKAPMVEWRSFLLGVISTAVGMLGLMGLITLGRRVSRRRHEQELRRMASLDS